MRHLGIIGGVGPTATAELYLRLNARYREARGRNPRLTVANLPVFVDMEQAHAHGEYRASDFDLISSLVQQTADDLVRAGARAGGRPDRRLAA